ncbi:uncharacterized protein FTJAE_1300 [Fusarium tjaetaba]|uniref:Uncharacterized protein n=1 Tax=Fusarium tjaetaba TaxID=1567544 RepID=A0A8H5W481_9HYPO|nr:uncharacterized protein FTJAE_1300 [Fusarium tjaetaba]KAF5648467.1 hypothetical protein FTJAE_1300 [Fusarium tjaetaba]
MSYNNDEQARRAQAVRDAQWASNRSQPQNTYPYQTGTYSNPDEPIIHTVQEPSMSLLNSPSSHSIPGLPHNPAPLPRTYQNPARQQDLRRTALENEAYNQGQSSRGPPNAGYSAQPSSYYGQAPQDPRRGTSGSSQGYPSVGSSAQPSNYYPQAPPDSRPGPSGSQAAQTHRLGSMSNPIIYEGRSANEVQQQEKRKKNKEERLANEMCSEAPCSNRVAPGKISCEYHMKIRRRSGIAYRERKRAEGKCYRGGCDRPAVGPGERCQECIDASRAYREARK